jgi:hypothetical protein
LLLLPQWLRLQRLRALFRWLLSQLRLRRWQPLWRLQLWSSLWLPLQVLRLVLFQFPSVEPVWQACPKLLLLWPIRFARHWLLPLPLLPLQQQMSLKRPSRLLCRLL